MIYAVKLGQSKPVTIKLLCRSVAISIVYIIASVTFL